MWSPVAYERNTVTEPTEAPKEVSLDDVPSLIVRLKQARQARIDWENIEAELRAEIQGKLAQAGAEVATLNGRPVVSWERIDRFSEKAFERAYPEIAEQYRTGRLVYSVDTGKLKATNPDLYDEFRVRQFRVLED